MKSILITGASTGIGEATALHLAKAGFNVFAGVRTIESSDKLRGKSSANLIPIILDVTQDETIHSAFQQIHQIVGNSGINGLVNNAGIAVAGALELLPIKNWREQLEVNVIGLVAVTQKFLPLIRQARGRIINVSSISGKVASPFLGAYAASKFAVEGLSDSLRRELAPHGIKVAVIEPGPILTPIWEKSAKMAEDIEKENPSEIQTIYQEQMNRFEQSVANSIKNAAPVNLVVKAIDHAIRSKYPQTRYVIGQQAKVASILARLLPDSALDHLVKKG